MNLSWVSGSLATMSLGKSLEKGNEIEVPSLGIKSWLKDDQVEVGSILPTVKEDKISSQQKKNNR
jgi:hypothetical protein